MESVKALTLRLATAIGFGIYFGVVVTVCLAKNRSVPESVQMLATRRHSNLQTEVRVNGFPVYTQGV